MPYADTANLRLYYESAGEGTPFILQAHHHSAWMPFQVPYFSQFYRVITFDRRGTGRSDSPPGPWSAADCARDVRDLMDALDIEKAIVGGASLGGVIACEFGLDYPDRSLALIVGHTVPYLWPLGKEWLEDEIRTVERGERPIVMQPRSYDWEVSGPPTAAPGFAESLAGQYMRTLGGGVGKDQDAAINGLRVLLNWDLRPRYAELQALQVPALVIVGGNEPQKTIELSYEWHQQLGNSEYVILPNTHHGAARENPIGWNEAVHGFLRRHDIA